MQPPGTPPRRLVRALPSRRRFLRRIAGHAAAAGGILAASLGLGVAGYHFLGGLAWIDAFVNAAMILTGMGPVNPIVSAPGKIFAALYALFSGVVFLTVMALLMAPVVHRFLHRFHLQLFDQDDEKPRTDR